MNNLSNIISQIKEESLIGTKINIAICKPISPLMQIVKSFSSELANKYPGGRWITVNDGSSPLYGRHLFIVPHADGRATIVHAPSASGLLHKVMQPVETKPKIDHTTKIAPKEETSIAKMQEEYKKREELVGQVKAKKQELIEQKKAKRQEMTEFLKEKLGINPEEKFNLAQTELDKQIKNKLDNNEITIEEARKEKQIGTLKNSQERTKEENVLLEDAKKLMTGNGHLVTNKELAEVIDTNKVDLLKFSMEIKQFQDEISKLERSIKQERVTESLVSTPITFEPITDKDVDKFVREEKAIIDNIGNHYNLVIKTRGGIDKDGNEIKVKGQNFIEKSIKKGGFELFNAMSSYFTNNTILDGDKYDILGSQNAAILLNNYLKEKLPDYVNDIDKLRGYVSKKADEISKEAINVGDSYLKSANQIYQLGKEEDSMFADITQAMGYALSRTNLAYQQYGLSEGALNQMAELLYQAQSNKDEKVKLSASSLSNLQDKINRLGLKDNDITIDKTGGKLVGIINESGLKKLIKEKPSLKNKTNLVGYPTATDIKQGKLNETDWLPSKMKQYIDGTKLEPTDYQQAAARLIAEQKRVYLNFDAGTGKSLTYLLAINSIEDRTGKPCKTLIVMPDKIKDNFNDEVEKFSSYKADIAESSSKNKRGEIYKNSNMVIINKEKLAADYNLLQEAGFDMIIVDEAHTVTQNEENSNKKSQQSEFLTKLAKTIPYYIAGSGTPTPTNLSQLHYHLDNISPDQYGTANEFMKKYGSLHKEAGFKDFVNKVFNEKINDNVFTVKKTLDTKLHLNEDFIPLSKKQKQQLKEINQSFLNGEINGKVRYDESKRVINTTNIEDNPKFKHIKGILDKHFTTSNPKEKVAFYFETYKDLGIFKEFLTKEYGKGSTVEFVGSGEESKKSDINKAKFKNDDNVKFSLHTPAGCTGLNLQYNGKEGGATRLIVASSGVNSWANVDQFFSRGNRKGAVKDVNAHIINFNVPLDYQAQEKRNSKKKIQGIIQEASKYDKNSLLT